MGGVRWTIVTGDPDIHLTALGISNMSVTRFTLFTAIGSLPWGAVLAYGGYRMGSTWEGIKHYTHALIYVSALVVAFLIVISVYNRRKRVK
jgi:membrane protein DedA with SNARE-associated domain